MVLGGRVSSLVIEESHIFDLLGIHENFAGNGARMSTWTSRGWLDVRTGALRSAMPTSPDGPHCKQT